MRQLTKQPACLSGKKKRLRKQKEVSGSRSASHEKVWDRKRADEAVKQYHVTLSEGNKNFGVFVTISFEPVTHKINKVVVVEEYK